MKTIAVASAVLIFSLLSLGASARAQTSNQQAQMQKQAKISMQQAEQTALRKEQGTIQSKELERENGKLIYSFDITTANGTHEVNVDAMNGKVVQDTVESKAKESQEKQQEMRHNPTPH